MSRGHKYGAKATVVDGIRFASQKEAKRYGELKLLEKAGEIRNLQLQVPYDLHVHQERDAVKIGRYVCDFFYLERIVRGVLVRTGQPSIVWEERIEDVKGFKTPLYRWKKKHVEAQYGIEIREI